MFLDLLKWTSVFFCLLFGLFFIFNFLCTFIVKTCDKIATTFDCTRAVVEVLHWRYMHNSGALRGTKTPLSELDNLDHKLQIIRAYHLNWDWHQPGYDCKLCATFECCKLNNCPESCLICNPFSSPKASKGQNSEL